MFPRLVQGWPVRLILASLAKSPDPASPGPGAALQLINPALLAELTGIDVVADFRSRDLAAVDGVYLATLCYIPQP